MAATTLGRLTVDLRTNTARFNQGMDTARGKLRGFSSMAAKAKAAVFALAGAGGMAYLIKQNLNYIDTLAKTSAKLGITTEALAKLRFAAQLTGVKTATLDMALQRMTRRLAEAGQGTGEAVKAIKELGLDAQRLASLSPDQAFTEIAQAMSKVTNQSDKVRLAFKFFDSEGVSLVNTLNLGAQGLAAAGQEAESFGVAISKVDARSVEAANDAMTKAKAVAGGLAQEISVKLAPVIERMANGFTVAVAKLREFFGLVPDEQRLNDLFKERADLLDKLEQKRSGRMKAARAGIRERIDEITREMNAIIARRDVRLKEYEDIKTKEAEIRTARMEARSNEPDEYDSHIELYRRSQEEQTKIAEREAERRAAAEKRAQDTINNMRLAAFQHAANLIRAIAPESKKAAILALAIEKGVAIAQIAINTKVAASKVAWNPALVASIEAWGATAIALVAATGIAQAAALNGGGSPSGVTSVAEQTPSESALNPFNTDSAQGALTINFYNPELLSDQSIDQLVSGIADRVNDRDVILIRPESRNGQDLSNG